MANCRIIQGDALAELRRLPADSVDCCVTSPPYWGLRDYGVSGQQGLEKTPKLYLAGMVAVFREVSRVLRDDGTLWLNLGDSYGGGNGEKSKSVKQSSNGGTSNAFAGCGMPKQLLGIPWRVAFALQADGWWLRQDIIWHKPNPMPESVTDRCTKAHEYIFLLSKSARYYYDQEAVAEPSEYPEDDRKSRQCAEDYLSQGVEQRIATMNPNGAHAYPTRNLRSVWTMPTQGYSEAHFATFPEELARRCILAGCPADGLVLDPFSGAGTTGLVALKLGRRFLGIELNPKYVKMAERRINNEAGLLRT